MLIQIWTLTSVCIIMCAWVRLCVCACVSACTLSTQAFLAYAYERTGTNPLEHGKTKTLQTFGNIRRTNEIHENNLELFLKGRNDLYLFEMCAHQTYTKKLSLFCFSSCKRTICLLLWKRHICQTFAVVLCASKRLSLLTLGSKIIFWTLAVNFEQRDLFTYSLI